MADMMGSVADIAGDCTHTESTRVCTDQICLRCGGNAIVTKRNISASLSIISAILLQLLPNHVIILMYYNYVHIFDLLHFDWRSLYRLQEHCSVWHFPRPYPA